MPYVFDATRPNSSDSTPSLRILTSFLSPSPLESDHPAGNGFFPSRSSHSKVPCTTINPIPPPATSPLDKPLKSSLRCTSSLDQRETSVPTSLIVRGSILPSTQKRVRFKDSDNGLVSVRFFRATERPCAISSPYSDIDSETEYESKDASFTQHVAAVPVPLEVTDLSFIPSPPTLLCSNVRLESLSLLPARPPVLRGIVHVRNIAYEKYVAVRFTFDRWVTTSEAHAGYIGPALAPPDADGTWDQFVFTISLELCAPRPGASSRTLLFAVQFSAPGVGEWWDNNGGNDFCVVLTANGMGGMKPPGLLAPASASGATHCL